MKRNSTAIIAAVLTVLSFALFVGCSPKKSLAGTWKGAVSFTNPANGQSITAPLTFHVTTKDDGGYSATVDSPMNRQTAYPLDNFKLDDNKVSFAITKSNATFSGTLNSDGSEISGTWSQATLSSQLTLKKEPDAK